MAWTLLEMGRGAEAQTGDARVIISALELDEPSLFLPVALDYAVVLAAWEHIAPPYDLSAPPTRPTSASAAGQTLCSKETGPVSIDKTQGALAADEWNDTRPDA